MMDPLFAALVLPAALYQILKHIIYVDKHYDIEDNDDWRSVWLRFASELPLMTKPPGINDETSIVEDWIVDSVASFSRKYKFLNNYCQNNGVDFNE